MEALTTALSKERETSIRLKMTAIATRFKALTHPPSLYPHHAAIRRAKKVKIKENLKYCKQNPFKKILKFYPYLVSVLIMNR
jgi:hypothetical protein